MFSLCLFVFVGLFCMWESVNWHLPSHNLTLQMYLYGHVKDDEEEDNAGVHTKCGHMIYTAIVP